MAAVELSNVSSVIKGAISTKNPVVIGEFTRSVPSDKGIICGSALFAAPTDTLVVNAPFSSIPKAVVVPVGGFVMLSLSTIMSPEFPVPKQKGRLDLD